MSQTASITPRLVHEVLDVTIRLIRSHAHWTAGALAIDNCGNVCNPYDPGVVRLCAVGAIMKASFDVVTTNASLGYAVRDYVEALVGDQCARMIPVPDEQPVNNVMRVNDALGHAAILGVLKNVRRLHARRAN
jgi:hypothetical protein